MTRWLQITSGRGPEECQWVVAGVMERLTDEAAKAGLNARVLDVVPGDRQKTFKSVLVALDGNGEERFAKEWQGTILWIGSSPFRPNHSRRNWYVGIEPMSLPDRPQWSESEIKVETMRSSGPGGQHVNKSETAVRVTHLPTGASTIAREERSQHLNRKLALARLHALFEEQAVRIAEQVQRTQWDAHNRLERGNPVRTFHGPGFKEKSTA